METKDIKNIERYSELLDTKFRIPGTNIRFGFDFIIGLFPVVGDVLSFTLSGGLLMMMIRRGASGKALSLMILNIFLDATIGSIPLIGDLFDLFFKANKRNLNLFQAHFDEGKHEGSAWPVVLTVLLILFFLFFLTAYLAIKAIGWLWNFIIS